MIAHLLEHELMPQCDYLVDLHSGGTSLYYPPTLLRGLGQTECEARQLKRLQEAFDLPYAWIFTSGGGRNWTARTAMGAANRNGVVPIMAELGGAATLSKEILELAERGLGRVLYALDMLPDYSPDAARGTRAMHAEGSIYAYDPGFFEPLKDIGDPVRLGEAVGLVHAVEDHSRTPVPVSSPYIGYVLAKRTLGQVSRGDAVL